MRWFLDTEFHERGAGVPIQLISIGLYAEDGTGYYAESGEYEKTFASPWLKENVLPYLTGPRKPRREIMFDIMKVMPPASKPEIWGYFSSYDWVLFCQIFGTMMDLPGGYPHHCRDIKQLCEFLGVNKDQLPKQHSIKHNALADARWNCDAFNFVMDGLKGKMSP